MLISIEKKQGSMYYRFLSGFIAVTFLFSMIFPPSIAQAQLTVLNLPVPGAIVTTSPGFTPVLIQGLTIHADNPLRFDFIVDTGDTGMTGQALEDEATKLIKYFLASLTVPEEELWVNLSPYEEGRIIPDKLGVTEMGRDLLAQDYILKQLTASLMFPEEELGKKFWDRVYKKSQEMFGTTNIPLNTFNKIWIVPYNATIYQDGVTAYVIQSHMKVMLEEDYLALQSNMGSEEHGMDKLKKEDAEVISGVTSEVVREVLIPEIEKEVNEGKNFAQLRQIFNALILATWYKRNLKETLLGQVYVDQNKVAGVDVEDKSIREKIYNQYVEAFKTGVYNFIKDDYDPASQKMISRKYFSGGVHTRIDYSQKGPDGTMLLEKDTFLAHPFRTPVVTNLEGIRGLPDDQRHEAEIGFEQIPRFNGNRYSVDAAVLATDAKPIVDQFLALRGPSDSAMMINVDERVVEPVKTVQRMVSASNFKAQIDELSRRPIESVVGDAAIGNLQTGLTSILTILEPAVSSVRLAQRISPESIEEIKNAVSPDFMAVLGEMNDRVALIDRDAISRVSIRDLNDIQNLRLQTELLARWLTEIAEIPERKIADGATAMEMDFNRHVVEPVDLARSSINSLAEQMEVLTIEGVSNDDKLLPRIVGQLKIALTPIEFAHKAVYQGDTFSPQEVNLIREKVVDLQKMAQDMQAPIERIFQHPKRPESAGELRSLVLNLDTMLDRITEVPAQRSTSDAAMVVSLMEDLGKQIVDLRLRSEKEDSGAEIKSMLTRLEEKVTAGEIIMKKYGSFDRARRTEHELAQKVGEHPRNIDILRKINANQVTFFNGAFKPFVEMRQGALNDLVKKIGEVNREIRTIDADMKAGNITSEAGKIWMDDAQGRLVTLTSRQQLLEDFSLPAIVGFDQRIADANREITSLRYAGSETQLQEMAERLLEALEGQRAVLEVFSPQAVPEFDKRMDAVNQEIKTLRRETSGQLEEKAHAVFQILTAEQRSIKNSLPRAGIPGEPLSHTAIDIIESWVRGEQAATKAEMRELGDAIALIENDIQQQRAKIIQIKDPKRITFIDGSGMQIAAVLGRNFKIELTSPQGEVIKTGWTPASEQAVAFSDLKFLENDVLAGKKKPYELAVKLKAFGEKLAPEPPDSAIMAIEKPGIEIQLQPADVEKFEALISADKASSFNEVLHSIRAIPNVPQKMESLVARKGELLDKINQMGQNLNTASDDISRTLIGNEIKLAREQINRLNGTIGTTLGLPGTSRGGGAMGTSQGSTLGQGNVGEWRKGGIDLNPAMLDLTIKRDETGAPLPLQQQPPEIFNIEGLIPVIINIVPMPNLPVNLGRDTTDNEPENLSMKMPQPVDKMEMAAK